MQPAEFEQMLAGDSYGTCNVVQRQRMSVLLPDKLVHFCKNRFGRRVGQLSAAGCQNKITEEGQAKA